MAFSAVTERGSLGEKVADTSHAMSPSAALTVNKIVFVLVGTDNIATTAGVSTTHSTLTDTDGHVWNKVYERTQSVGAALDGATVSLWWVKVTTEIGTGDVITITLSASTTSKLLGIWEVTVGAGQTIQLAGSTFGEGTGVDPAALTLSGLASKEYLFLGLVGREAETPGWTEDADYTNVFAAEGIISSTAGAATSNITLNAGYRIATLTGDTFDIIALSGDVGQDFTQALLAFEEVTPVAVVPPPRPTVVNFATTRAATY